MGLFQYLFLAEKASGGNNAINLYNFLRKALKQRKGFYAGNFIASWHMLRNCKSNSHTISGHHVRKTRRLEDTFETTASYQADYITDK